VSRPAGPVGPAGPEPEPPAEAGVTSWRAAYSDLAGRLSAIESNDRDAPGCIPIKVVTRVEDRYDPLTAVGSGPVGITAYTGYACAAQ
jgi:hypothetical protein